MAPVQGGKYLFANQPRNSGSVSVDVCPRRVDVSGPLHGSLENAVRARTFTRPSRNIELRQTDSLTVFGRMTLPRGLDMKEKDRGPSLAGGDGKKLMDYPAVPRTPPLEERKDEEVSWLERELDRERTYLSVLQKENSEIEEILRDLEKEVTYVKSHFPQNLDGDGKIHADNEHWFRYEAQMEVNRKLEREKRRLESEIKQMEDEGMINLDSLTQSELLLYVKQLERTKTDLLSDLRAKEWSLDKQAKDFHHLNETKRSLEAQIKHYDGERALFRHYKRIACPSASVPASRQSSQKSSARRVRLAKQGAGEKKLSSLSQENLSESVGAEVMFRSLDERELKRSSPVPRHQGRVNQPESEDVQKGEQAGEEGSGGVEASPESTRNQGKTTPVPSKTVRNCYSKDRSPSPSISVVATEKSDGTEMDESSPCGNGIPGTESGIGSPSDYADEYEDDFEESDTDGRKELRSGEDEALDTSGENGFGNCPRRA